jgi:hypothetical protein
MKVSKGQLLDASKEGILTQEQVDELYNYLSTRPDTGPSFNFTNILYYFGGLVAIGAMTLFMNLGWEAFGGWGILFISLAYAVMGLILISRFEGSGHTIPAGICATFVMAITPLAIYGLQQGMGWWPGDEPYREYHRQILWHWIYLELGTLAVGAIMLWRYRYPFLVMPIAATLWYMSMDFAAMLTGVDYEYEFFADFSMLFGLITILIAFWADIRSRKVGDYAFWLYIFGVIAFWSGLSMQGSGDQLSRFIYFCINLVLIGTGAVLSRRVFVVFGVLGSAGYLGYLASDVFEDSWLFPIALTVIGLSIVYLGVAWQKNEASITSKIRSFLPLELRELLSTRSP